MLTSTVLEPAKGKEWNFAPLCRRVVATRTHYARIATLLRRQNMSRCALLISRPSYLSQHQWAGSHKWKWKLWISL